MRQILTDLRKAIEFRNFKTIQRNYQLKWFQNLNFNNIISCKFSEIWLQLSQTCSSESGYMFIRKSRNIKQKREAIQECYWTKSFQGTFCEHWKKKNCMKETLQQTYLTTRTFSHETWRVKIVCSIFKLLKRKWSIWWNAKCSQLHCL